ncbi:unnamed protein product, partial [Ectocarpus sp. 8 AP-2014]
MVAHGHRPQEAFPFTKPVTCQPCVVSIRCTAGACNHRHPPGSGCSQKYGTGLS